MYPRRATGKGKLRCYVLRFPGVAEVLFKFDLRTDRTFFRLSGMPRLPLLPSPFPPFSLSLSLFL